MCPHIHFYAANGRSFYPPETTTAEMTSTAAGIYINYFIAKHHLSLRTDIPAFIHVNTSNIYTVYEQRYD